MCRCVLRIYRTLAKKCLQVCSYVTVTVVVGTMSKTNIILNKYLHMCHMTVVIIVLLNRVNFGKTVYSKHIFPGECTSGDWLTVGS